jgi:hypothetical protein
VDPDPGGPKTCGSGSGFGSGSATLEKTINFEQFKPKKIKFYHFIVNVSTDL